MTTRFVTYKGGLTGELFVELLKKLMHRRKKSVRLVVDGLPAHKSACMRHRLKQSPRVLYFRGLRGCVKQLAGARRWSGRCQELHDHIVDYMRGCLTAEASGNPCALVVH